MSAKLLVGAASLAALAGLAGSALAQDPAAVERGKAKFEHSCEPCHGDGPGDDGRAMLPGTDALRIKYRGEIPALIERRAGLSFEVLKLFVRQGVASMPPFRPTEITDDEIADIVAYLDVTSREYAASQR